MKVPRESPGPCVQSLDEGIAESEEQGGRPVYACKNEEYGSKIISCVRPGADGRSPLKQGRYSHFPPPLPSPSGRGLLVTGGLWRQSQLLRGKGTREDG
jgi:hypothetical protein